jgi:hypothetical protein
MIDMKGDRKQGNNSNRESRVKGEMGENVDVAEIKRSETVNHADVSKTAGEDLRVFLRRGRALGLFGERLAHHSVLTCHPATQGALDLCAEGKFVQVVGLLGGGHESLLGERLVL